MLIACSQLRMRRKLEREAPDRLTLKSWGYPWLTYASIAGMVAVIAAMALVRAQPLVEPRLAGRRAPRGVAAHAPVGGAARAPAGRRTALPRA